MNFIRVNICLSHSCLLPTSLSSGSTRCFSAMTSSKKSSNTHIPNTSQSQKFNIREYLSKPSWSVESLLPTPEQTAAQPLVSSQQLRHLLRLSALPEPKDAEEEKKLLDTLASQLYFVREIQRVDTTGVEPLRALRDERLESEKTNEVTLKSLKEALAQEEIVGTYHKRIRRKQTLAQEEVVRTRHKRIQGKQDQVNASDNPKGWKPLDHAQKTVGKFFVVDSGKSTPT